MSDPYVGEIRCFGFNFAPSGWMSCNGQLLAISQYETLFVLIGTTYGGDGVSTFGLPDLRGRLPLHQGQGGGLSNRVVGEFTGGEHVTLGLSNLPTHTHTITASTAIAASTEPGITDQPAGAVPHAGNIYGSASSLVSMASTSLTATASVAGASVALSILQPILVMNFCISLFGIFPSRN